MNKKWASQKQVMNKLRILSHEQAMTKPWKSQEQGRKKLSHKQAMWTSNEQGMNNGKISDEQVKTTMNKTWKVKIPIYEQPWTSLEQA